MIASFRYWSDDPCTLQALESQKEEIPESLSNLLLNYKALKKKIKAIPVIIEGANEKPASASELEFVEALNSDVTRFNDYFMDKEELAVMKLERAAEEVQKLKREIDAGFHASQASKASSLMQKLVDFHGDLVLTLHWSLINFSALSKILKKHDKRTGVKIRAPYLTSVLQQPFNSTNIMSRLVKRAEELVEDAGRLIHSLKTSKSEPDALSAAADLSNSEPKSKKQQQRAKNALDMWENLAKTASTPSTIGVGVKRPPPDILEVKAAKRQ